MRVSPAQYTPHPESMVIICKDSRLLASHANGTVKVYALRIEDLIALAKARLTRGLTPEECRQYLHMKTCPKSISTKAPHSSGIGAANGR